MSNKHHFANSSSIAHCDYHDVDGGVGTLEIGFTSGAVYHYPHCPKIEYESLKKAASAGSHFHANIRKYKAVKVSG